MITIMFVCHGNICRSPMAEFVLKDMVKCRGLEKDFVIASSATSTEEIWNGIGNPVYLPAKAVLENHSIDSSGKRAVQLKASDYDKYDLFIGMDSVNIRNMTRILKGDKDNKIHKLMEYTGSNADVSDPWYTRDFDKCHKDIYAGCGALLNLLLSKNNELKNRFLHIDFQSATDDVSKCQNGTLNCTLEELAIINAIAENPSITQKALAEKVNSTERTIKRRTVEMQKKGFIQRANGKRNGHWEILISI